MNAKYIRIAEIHIGCIEKGFLSSLGASFLALLYQAIDESDNSTLILAEEEGRIIGFVAGTLGIKQVYRTMTEYWGRLFFALAPSLFSARKLRRILEVLLYSKDPGIPGQDVPSAELLSISVVKEYRGKQHADRLYQEVIKFFKSRATSRFKITAGESLTAAHSFYRRMGAKAIGKIEVHKGENSILFVQEVL